MVKTLYAQDFYSWALAQADLLRQGQFEALDLPHLVEEVEDFGNRHYDPLESRLTQSTRYEGQYGEYAGSEQVAKEVLSLPIWPELVTVGWALPTIPRN